MSEPFHISLDSETVQRIERHLREHPGECWIGKISREMFDGENFKTCGRLYLELGPVPEIALPKLRAVVAEARATRQKVPRGASRA